MIPKRPGYSVWPPCTRVFRCSGCCTNAIYSCQPDTTSEKLVKVSKKINIFILYSFRFFCLPFKWKDVKPNNVVHQIHSQVLNE
jgi:hypothetical protein